MPAVKTKYQAGDDILVDGALFTVLEFCQPYGPYFPEWNYRLASLGSGEFLHEGKSLEDFSVLAPEGSFERAVREMESAYM